ncbi:hypothetical protein CJF30_00011154 [Rutstroemia sp. NJR-2017a BBW]|nr:hypothetical protein CJF30_00011154 [Rutstroemia sp. NJR-2017a BBW]
MSYRDAESGDIFPKLMLRGIIRAMTIRDLENSEGFIHYLLTFTYSR